MAEADGCSVITSIARPEPLPRDRPRPAELAQAVRAVDPPEPRVADAAEGQ